MGVSGRGAAELLLRHGARVCVYDKAGVRAPDGCEDRSRLSPERALRGTSLTTASAHYVRRSDECPAANLERHVWVHPFTGERRTDSFADLFDEARLAYPALAEAFARGGETRLRELVAGLDFAGRPEADD